MNREIISTDSGGKLEQGLRDESDATGEYLQPGQNRGPF